MNEITAEEAVGALTNWLNRPPEELDAMCPPISLRKVLTEIARLTQERDAWKDAVIDAAVVNWTLSGDDETNPRGAVNRLICGAIDQERHLLREQVKMLTQERDEMTAPVGSLISMLSFPAHDSPLPD